MADTYDFSVRAGNTGTEGNEAGLVIQEPDTRPVADYEYVFITGEFGSATTIRKTSSDGGILKDTAENTVTIPFTTVETRSLLAATTDVAYEIERRTDAPTQRTILQGSISVIQGVNDD